MTLLALRLRDGRPATLALRPDATVLSVAETDVSSYDLCGRPYVLVRGEWTSRRALDGRLLQKRAAAGGEPRLRRVASPAEGASVVEAARCEALEMLDALARDAAGEPWLRAEGERRLRRIASMDAQELRRDAARFAASYRPVGILPPDQYLALVVQVTEGCSWNACTFCELYRDTRFHVKEPAELLAHAEAVRDYFGDALPLRRSLFLGDANALCVAHDRLRPLIEIAVRAFPEAARGGLHAFVDVWTGRRKTAAEYREYAGLGLRRIYVGLESGDPELLAWLEKPGSRADAVELVAALHEAGLDVGVIVLLGAGGERFFDAHAHATAEVLTQMRLGPRDLVYFSELVEHPARDYARRARAEGIAALDSARLRDQRQAIESAFAPADASSPPRRAAYDIREFVY